MVGTGTELANQAAELAADGQFEAAAAAFEQALRLQPGDAAQHEMLAQCRMEAGQDEAAYEAGAAAVRLRPDWPVALLTLARAARNSGRLKEAGAAYNRCLQAAAAAAGAAAGAAGEENEDVAAAARQELGEVRQLLQLQLGHQLGLPGLRLLEQHGTEAGPSGVVWEAGALLAWFLVQQQQQQQQAGGGAAGPGSCSGCSSGPPGEPNRCGAAAAPAPPSTHCGAMMRGSRVLELGAGGTGIVGLAAACLGAAVTATDLPEVLPQLQASAALNRAMVGAAGGSLTVATLDWRHPDAALLCPQPPALQYDWLLGADLVFSPAAVDPLAATVAAAVRHAAAVAGGGTGSDGTHGGTSLKVLVCHKQRHEEVDTALLATLKAAGVALRVVLRDAGSRCTVLANDAACVALHSL